MGRLVVVAVPAVPSAVLAAGPARAAQRSRPRVPAWVLPGVAVALGVAIRARQFASGRSFWLDEAMVVRNVLDRGYGHLAGRLDDHQGAPIGWLYLERAASSLPGGDEYTLRVVPFLASLLLLGVAWDLARRLLPRTLVPVAVLAVALAPGLVRYAAEAKQHESDALAVLLLVDAAVAMTARPGWPRPRDAWGFGVLGAVCALCSYPASLALAGLGVVLCAQRLPWGRLPPVGRRRGAAPGPSRDGAGARARAGSGSGSGSGGTEGAGSGDTWGAVSLLGGLAVAAAGSSAQYVLTARFLARDDTLAAYWSGGYPPDGASPWGVARWFVPALGAFVHDPMRAAWPALVGVLIVLGVARLAAGAPRHAALLAAPAVAQTGAAIAGSYPLAGRIALDLVPLALIAMTAAARPPSGLGRAATLAAGGLVVAALATSLAPALATTAGWARSPLTVTELGPVLDELAHRRQPGDAVLLYWGTGRAGEYYAARAGVPVSGAIGVFPPQAGRRCADAEVLSPRLPASGRLWVVTAVISQRAQPGPADDAGRAADVSALDVRLDAVMTELDHVRAPGAAATLFRMRPAPVPPPAAASAPGDRRDGAAALPAASPPGRAPTGPVLPRPTGGGCLAILPEALS